MAPATMVGAPVTVGSAPVVGVTLTTPMAPVSKVGASAPVGAKMIPMTHMMTPLEYKMGLDIKGMGRYVTGDEVKQGDNIEEMISAVYDSNHPEVVTLAGGSGVEGDLDNLSQDAKETTKKNRAVDDTDDMAVDNTVRGKGKEIVADQCDNVNQGNLRKKVVEADIREGMEAMVVEVGNIGMNGTDGDGQETKMRAKV